MELQSPNFCFFASVKFNAGNIIFNQIPIIMNKINNNSSKNSKKYYYQYINCTRTIFFQVILATFTSSIVSIHSSVIWFTNFFLHLKFP